MTLPKSLAFVAACISIFGMTWFLVVFGGLITCCSASIQGRTDWIEKIVYGWLPLVFALILTVCAFRLARRIFASGWKAWSLACVLALLAAVGDLCLLFWYRQFSEEIALHWDMGASTFNWGKGEVRLPEGFSYMSETGIDTHVGEFTSRDGRLVVHHDIGDLAGEHGGIGSSRQTLVEGARVRVAHHPFFDDDGKKMFFSAVSFPDNGCANLIAISNTSDAKGAIDLIARTFQPKNWLPHWILSLLPEIARSDCRYRFRPIFDLQPDKPLR